MSPVPAQDQIVLNYSLEPAENYWFTIVSATGQVLLEERIPSGTQRVVVPVQHLPNGLYSYRVGDNKQTVFVGKIVMLH